MPGGGLIGEGRGVLAFEGDLGYCDSKIIYQETALDKFYTIIIIIIC